MPVAVYTAKSRNVYSYKSKGFLRFSMLGKNTSAEVSVAC